MGSVGVPQVWLLAEYINSCLAGVCSYVVFLGVGGYVMQDAFQVYLVSNSPQRPYRRAEVCS